MPELLEPSLSVEPRTWRFPATPERNGCDAADAFAACLANLEANTERIEIRSAADLLPDTRSGLIRGRWRYTTEALRELCRLLMPGLSRVIRELADDDPGRARSPDMAGKLLCDMIRLRFADLRQSYLVCDSQSMLIEGIVGGRYEHFSHQAVFRASDRFLARLEEPCVFHEAILVGRRLSLRYREERPMFAIPAGETHEPFFAGWQLQNSEVGECALGVAPLVLRRWSDGKAVGPLTEGSRLIHVRRRRFEDHFQRLLATATRRRPNPDKLRRQVLALREQSLGLTARDSEPRQMELATQLRRMQLPLRLARQIVHRACRNGSYRKDVLPERPSLSELRQAYAGRTAFDLLNAICTVADSQRLQLRERLEQLAYRMFDGRWRPR